MGLEKSNLDPHLPLPCALYNVATGPKVEHAIGRWRGLNSRLGGSDEVTSSLPGTNACNTQGLSCAIASTVPPLLILPRVHRVCTDPYFTCGRGLRSFAHCYMCSGLTSIFTFSEERGGSHPGSHRPGISLSIQILESSPCGTSVVV